MTNQEQQGPRSVVVAGATGWAGSALCRGIHAAPDLALVGGVSRSHAGRPLGEALALPDLTAATHASVTAALSGAAPDVLVEYTQPDSARDHVLAALEAGVHVVLGTSGLSDEDFDAIDAAARKRERGVLACGNFALTAVLMLKFSELAAHWIRSWEVIDYAGAGKRDAPSGTARELVHRLAAVGASEGGVPVDELQGERATRGANLGGTQVHSVRLPGYTLGVESIFGAEGERLSLRHDASTSAEPYVAGALLAIRKVHALVGLHRGLDTVMDFGDGDDMAGAGA